MSSFLAFPERAQAFARICVVGTVLGLFFVLNIIVISVPFIGAVKIPLFLMAIFYWAIYRPTLVPLWLVFLAGVLMDLLGQTPLGFNALVFVLTQWFVFGQRRFLMTQPFLVIWLSFAVLYCSALGLKWSIMGALGGHWLPVGSLGVFAFSGLALFPLVCLVLHFTHKILPDPRSAIR